MASSALPPDFPVSSLLLAVSSQSGNQAQLPVFILTDVMKINVQEMKSEDTFNVLIAYDNLEGGKAGKELCDRIIRQFAPEAQFTLSLCKLSLLNVRPMRQAFQEKAAHASLIIFSIRGEDDLFSAAKLWCQTIAAENRFGAALVAQFYGISKMVKELSPAYIFLKAIAVRAGMVFFSEIIEPRENAAVCTYESIQKRAHAHTWVMEGILRQTQPFFRRYQDLMTRGIKSLGALGEPSSMLPTLSTLGSAN